ncbi:MAG: hypothetical protein JSU91_06210 [Thermoplasmatales archaeon]|nr:MAG: hypothetical protein JSU91_06210 [Thermoplasmatales archaeon]
MNKLKILLITILIISTGFLSGCNQKENDIEVDLSKVEVVNHTVETIKDLVGKDYKKITGYISNNAGILIKEIKIEITFYDINNNYLYIKNSYVYDLKNKETREFSTVYHSNNDNYNKVDWDDIKFKVIIL